MSARLIIACLLAAWVGCGKQPASSPPEPAAAAKSVPNPTSAVQPGEPAVSDETQIAALVNELTQAVRKYSVEQRRVPKSLEELVANGYLSRVPPAPAGKKFVIDKNLQVNLANR